VGGFRGRFGWRQTGDGRQMEESGAARLCGIDRGWRQHAVEAGLES
jgi:hypothetical protein